jgi:hypothetical protein
MISLLKRRRSSTVSLSGGKQGAPRSPLGDPPAWKAPPFSEVNVYVTETQAMVTGGPRQTEVVPILR